MFITKRWNKEKQKPKIEFLQNLDLIEDVSDEASASVFGGMSDGFMLSPADSLPQSLISFSDDPFATIGLPFQMLGGLV
ncbi:MAG: hypothetical protein WA919_23875 [Coleofasciculaceae cyanobacterium]